jgi:hypothetical protein
VGCVPPAAPVTNQGIYQSCVCQSALLTALHGSGAPCEQFCSTDDATAISQYYIALCNGPVVAPAPTGTETTAPTTGIPTNTAAAGAGNGVKNNTNKPTWIESHWRWLVMVIVILIAIIFFWVGGVFLRRHIHRKREQKKANMAGSDAFVESRAGPSTPSKPPASNGSVAPPMTMSGGRGSVHVMNLDGGVGGIAPPRGKLRSRTNTLQSMGQSRNSSPQPVVWGPHQHQAHAARGGSPVASIPPSPTAVLSPPRPIYRNPDATMSEPRFVQYKATPTSITVQPTLFRDVSESTISAHSTPLGDEVHRPVTAHEVGRGGSIGRPVMTGYNNEPYGNEPQPQSAEFFDAGGPSFVPPSNQQAQPKF